MASAVPFFLVDVFADEPLTGNPLALVPDADDLPVERMQAIAREFNQSETTFLVRPTRDDATWRLRSFTPIGAEVFGAGHNAMGAWIWLADAGRLPAAESVFAQEIGDEVLPVRVTRRAGERSEVSMDQSAPVFGRTAEDRAALADALGLGLGDLADDAAQTVSTGADHLLVPVRGRDVVDRVDVDPGRLLRVLRDAGAEGCYVYSRDPIDAESVAYARFFNPTVGITEDPATGTAAGPLVAALVAAGSVAEGAAAVVEQGFALGRPSRLRVTVTGTQVRLSGSGLIVADGNLRL
ncbi:PhzF family phenazine biosynthesis protein [Cryptosporangium aurantiacum]|uniref:Phenazine biosynthesis protein PhzF family n=1 Tax=Cryptosporangium aurantiacum TaxID=134849 RepID=A0A1M7R1G4_9ACTN|nr:PhzF family phenazine biosynthesis protein [Cryptosporangium aurantiacum]SHN38508.1 phenazine biosynthesis protein PhzF family [Cryptosporangium aurantiacum]